MTERTTTTPESEATAEAAGESAARAKERVAEAMEQNRNAFADEVLGIARALHTTAETLRQQGQAPVARYSSRAASAAEQFGHGLAQKSLTQLMRDLEDFTRRQPALVLGAAAATGFLATRLFRAPRQQTEGSRSQQVTPATPPTEAAYPETGGTSERR